MARQVDLLVPKRYFHNFGPILKKWRQNDSNSTAKRHQFDSNSLTPAYSDAILEAETVRPRTLRGRLDSSRAPRGKRLAVSIFDNLRRFAGVSDPAQRESGSPQAKS